MSRPSAALRPMWLAVGALLVAAPLFPVDAQLRRLRDAARRAAEREVERQVERAVTGMVRCAFDDPACIERAKEEGQPVEITDEEGNVLRDGNGNPISDPSYAQASRQKPGEGVWRTYDFVPGERTLFLEDLSEDEAGDFPQRLEFGAGNMEVVDTDGMRALRVTGGSQRDARFAVPLPEKLPERFTLEFPVHWSARNLYVRVYFSADGAPQPPAGGNYPHPHLVVDHRSVGVYDWQQDAPTATEAVPEIHEGWVTVRLMADGEHVKAYVNERRVANIPQTRLGRDVKLWFTLRDGTDEVPIFVGPIMVAAGGRDLYDRLEADGSVATRGILFASDSDVILPESTPTLLEIGGMLQEHPDLRLKITGHTDSLGSDSHNQDLSERRAAAVVRFLVEESAIERGRLESEGMGESSPVTSNETAEGRATNRRVELSDLREGAGATPRTEARPTPSPAPVAESPQPPASRAEATSGEPPATAAGAAPNPSIGPRPPQQRGSLDLVVGGATTPFTITQCRTEAYEGGAQPGSLTIDFAVTAVGEFRGRAAALFFAKTSVEADHIDLYLTELTEGQVQMGAIDLHQDLLRAQAEALGHREREVNETYSYERLAEQDLSPEEMVAKLDERAARLDQAREEAALEYPHARVFGTLRIDGSTITFEGGDQTSVHPRDDQLRPVLAELRGLERARVAAECGA